MTEATKQKLREANLGKRLTQEHKDKIGAANRGKKMPAHQLEQLRQLSLGRPAWNKGKPFSEEVRTNMSRAKGGKLPIINSAHYKKAHKWIKKQLGQPQLCEFCGSTSGAIDWSNKSQEYLLDVADWQRLCRSCHQNYDIKLKTQETPEWNKAQKEWEQEKDEC